MASSTPSVDFLENLTGQKIDQIKKLSLEAMGFSVITSDVFNKMTSLTNLNLSRNVLTEIPADLNLPHLKELDISDNTIKKLTFTKNLPALKELQTDGNGMDIAEKYIVVTLCPGLMMLNNYKIDTLRKVVANVRDKMWPQVQDVWAASLADKYVNGIQKDTWCDIFDRFMYILSKQQLIATTTVSKYAEFMVKRLATELLNSVYNGSYQTPKKKRINKSIPGTPGTPRFTAIKRKGIVSSLPQIPKYEPVHFIRCHSGGSKDHADNYPTDNATQVWCAEFEPNPHKSGEFTNTVATVGGNSICLIDCNSGRVMRRYKETGERFFCLAWTTLSAQHGKSSEPTNILAVAGVRGCVRLLHPQQLVCYHEFVVSTKRGPEYINSIIFHPRHTSHLYCGDSNGNITVWDIGVPAGSEFKTTVTLMHTLRSQTDSVVSLICDKKDHLIAGCEGALLMWDLALDSRRKTREADSELILPGKKDDTDVDGLTAIGDDMVACKITGQGCIYLWRISSVLEGNRKKATIKIYPMAVLEWAEIDTMYLNLGASKDGLLACGDNKGQLWLYNVQRLLKTSSIQAEELLRPSRILPWPICETQTSRNLEALMVDLGDKEVERIVNNVTISPDNEYVVACTADNMVCIWKQQ